MERTSSAAALEPVTRLDDEKAREFQAVLKAHAGEKILVVLNGFPDPDGISSALAHRFLAADHGIETTILTFHDPSHQENRALLKTLDIQLILHGEDFDPAPYSAYCLVDSQKATTPIDEQLKGKALMAFVDHHKRVGEVAAEYVDIREDVGATASVYTSYLRHRWPVGLPADDSEVDQLATSLVHGIRSDTQNLMEATRFDYAALTYLDGFVDKEMLKKISRQSLNPEIMELIQRALQNKQTFDNYMLATVGVVRAEDRDGIPQAADFLLRRAGTDTVLVFGIVDGQTIDGSLRTSSQVIDPDQFLKKTFGCDANGVYYGGGNLKDKGGFQIPLGFLAEHPNTKKISTLARELVEMRFKDSIGRNQPEENEDDEEEA